jgi:PST family polysaccharide transporter
MLGLNMLGYEWKGLEGLGISFMAGYSIYFFQVFFLCRYKYKFNFERKFFRILAIQLIIGAACFLTSRLMISFSFYFFGSVLIIISGLYSFKELNKRLKLIPVKFLNKNQ